MTYYQTYIKNDNRRSISTELVKKNNYQQDDPTATSSFEERFLGYIHKLSGEESKEDKLASKKLINQPANRISKE